MRPQHFLLKYYVVNFIFLCIKMYTGQNLGFLQTKIHTPSKTNVHGMKYFPIYLSFSLKHNNKLSITNNRSVAICSQNMSRLNGTSCEALSSMKFCQTTKKKNMYINSLNSNWNTFSIRTYGVLPVGCFYLRPQLVNHPSYYIQLLNGFSNKVSR